ncbi:hypothetical protein FHW88_000022 [Mucilaginibacter sp. SG538B]|uniref:hypothetical protein n=1 Tax=unclassified Mucilaginibacter TaxID=2617802 RepID=UPI0008717948|nr:MULTISPECIES: hypothetical protein [unclassified Mucilaginibacter]NVM61746.1 hypothetical protein [Mucilaginibacter sp. SG538B]SCW85738.1 hypothetical protein SAMN03159284_05039 [Mucilaginibacter sp. NFR10]
MNFSKNRVIASSVLIIGSVIVYIIYYNLKDELKNIVNFFTLYGTFGSLYGLCLAYLQIQSIKETSEKTRLAVDSSLVRINQVLSISEIARSLKIIQEIQTSILHDKSELALLRMKDLKQILIQVKYNGDLQDYTNSGAYNQHITDISIDINNINDSLLKKKTGVNFSKVNQNLEQLATVLTEFENKLKFERHD